VEAAVAADAPLDPAAVVVLEGDLGAEEALPVGAAELPADGDGALLRLEGHLDGRPARLHGAPRRGLEADRRHAQAVLALERGLDREVSLAVVGGRRAVVA